MDQRDFESFERIITYFMPLSQKNSCPRKAEILIYASKQYTVKKPILTDTVYSL